MAVGQGGAQGAIGERARVVAAFEVVSPGQLRDQVGALWELESKAFIARELAMSLRQKHVDNQNQPSATSTPPSAKPGCPGGDKSASYTWMWLWQLREAESWGSLTQEPSGGATGRARSPIGPNAPMSSLMDQDDSPEVS
jgi:hypothetical protein